MKAATWRGRVAIAVMLTLIADPAALWTAQAKSPPEVAHAMTGVPTGMPILPGLGEAMQPAPGSGLALNGFDPVAYHSAGRAVPGQERFELTHRGTAWRFVSAANLAAFRDAPSVYEPAFAGFDALGVSEGRVVETNPALFAVVGGRLVLFRSAENRLSFVADTAAMVRAEALWPQIYETLAR